MTGSLARTPLYDWHRSHEGRLVDFAGWEMPVQYGSIVAEHTATRTAASLFDVSHMGRFRFDGPGAAAFLDRLVTRRVLDLPLGRIRYGLVTNREGGILDDVLVYRLHERDGADFFIMVVNASNRAKIIDWIHQHLVDGDNVNFLDITTHTAMIAVQGPLALALAQPSMELKLGELKNYSGGVTHVLETKAIVSRTGYTGEDGCELIVLNSIAAELWETLLAAGHNQGVIAAGLGARDTLRLEAAMPLYGHELAEDINPFQAGLDFAVNLEGRDFVGHAALVRAKTQPLAAVRVGLTLTGKRVPRENCPILAGGQPVGRVTSGTFSPTLQRSIAMGYVPPAQSAPGTALEVDIRGRCEPAEVVPLPFYRRNLKSEI